ncbi:hypothetical protein LSH36_1040g00018 [Paralvinella palmiformis]|uniref:C-type lectin domain-containing protein n=1 Tax=Paralvinella palmiformis TaxID=53620 RepID=A0AAD9MQ31_9ANNE|nr:hypothetical protein LSH36_1040g00018 [Paralvinella palmiformis]
MSYTWSLLVLLNAVHYLGYVKGDCPRDRCNRRRYTPLDGFYHIGNIIAEYDNAPLKVCVVNCRRYLECRGFNMRWSSSSRILGSCTLLGEVTVRSGATPDGNSTHYYWCPDRMVYYLRTGSCLASKTQLDWYEGKSFCNGFHPAAHMFDIKSRDEETAYLTMMGRKFEPGSDIRLDMWQKAVSGWSGGILLDQFRRTIRLHELDESRRSVAGDSSVAAVVGDGVTGVGCRGGGGRVDAGGSSGVSVGSGGCVAGGDGSGGIAGGGDCVVSGDGSGNGVVGGAVSSGCVTGIDGSGGGVAGVGGSRAGVSGGIDECVADDGSGGGGGVDAAGWRAGGVAGVAILCHHLLEVTESNGTRHHLHVKTTFSLICETLNFIQ